MNRSGSQLQVISARPAAIANSVVRSLWLSSDVLDMCGYFLSRYVH